MKKTMAATFLALGTLFMFSNAAFANSCTYQMKIKSYVGAPVEIQNILYKYVDDPFGTWVDIGTDPYTLNNNTDVFTSQTLTNIVLTCDKQRYAMSVDYWCTGPNGVSHEYGKDTGRMDGGHTNNAYIIITGCNDDLFYKEDSWPETSFAGYVAGYIYGTNSNANNKCLQAQTDSFANGVDVHVWDKCINGGPQKNRQWKYDTSTGYIHNIDDPSYCLQKQTNGYSVGDNIHMWKCNEGIEENKQWEYNFNGQHLIRSKANHNFCIVRGGANVGDAIHLWSCDPNNNMDQNGRWNITWGESG